MNKLDTQIETLEAAVEFLENHKKAAKTRTASLLLRQQTILCRLLREKNVTMEGLSLPGDQLCVSAMKQAEFEYDEALEDKISLPQRAVRFALQAALMIVMGVAITSCFLFGIDRELEYREKHQICNIYGPEAPGCN